MVLAVSLVILLFASDASCQTVVTTYNSKSSEELLCPITDQILTASWTDETDETTTLAIYLGPETDILIPDSGSKHQNFNYTISATSFNLLIQNVEAEDGGDYRCTTTPGSLHEHTVVVEVIPGTFSLDCFVGPNVTCPELGVIPTSELICVCAANGVRPGTLYLDIPDAHTAQQNESIENGNLFDLRLNVTVPVTESMAEVSCSVKGYNTNESIPSELIIKTFMISQPTCSLDISFDQECKEATLTCSCTASPTDGEPPSGDGIMYSYFNGTGHIIETGTTTTARTNYVEAGTVNTYSCRGCNGLYYGDTSYVTNSSECKISTTAPLSTNEPTSTKAMETTTVEPESKSTDNPESGSLETGAIVGISLGALAVVIVIVVIAVMMFKPGTCCSISDSSSATDGNCTAKHSDIYEDELPLEGNEMKTDGMKSSSATDSDSTAKNSVFNGDELPLEVNEMKTDGVKSSNNGNRSENDAIKAPPSPYYATVMTNRNTHKDNDLIPDHSSAITDNSKSSGPEQQIEKHDAALAQGNKPPSDEFRKPKKDTTE